MKSHVGRIRKLHPKAGDILLVTLKGYPSYGVMELVKNEFAGMPFLKGVFVIFTTDKIQIKKSRPKDGKHQVFMNNLEYLEHMSKKGESK
jgi:hypothetical protein